MITIWKKWINTTWKLKLKKLLNNKTNNYWIRLKHLQNFQDQLIRSEEFSETTNESETFCPSRLSIQGWVWAYIVTILHVFNSENL